MVHKTPAQKFSMGVKLHFSLVFTVLAVAISVIWFAVVLGLKLRMYYAMLLTSDLAYYCNVLYNTGWKQFLYSDFAYFQYGFKTFLSDHFSPSLGLLALIYQIAPSPVTLLVVQTFAIAAAAWLLAQIGKMLISRDAVLPRWTLITPLLAQGLYLFNRSTVEATIDSVYGFHHDSLIPLFLLATVFFYLKYKFSKSDNKRGKVSYLVCAGVCFFILLGLKENMPLVCAAFLVAVLLFGRRADKKLMLWALACCVIMITASSVFQYLVSTNKRNLEAISSFFTLEMWSSRLGFLHYISRWRILLSFIPMILTPIAYVPFLAEFALQLVVDASPFDWHSFPIIAIGSLAAMAGTMGLLLRMRKWSLLKRTLAGIAITIYMMLLYIPAVWGGCNKIAETPRQFFWPSAKISAGDIESMARLIPSGAKLATTTNLLSFFANRPHLRWPDQLEDVDMILTSDNVIHRADIWLCRRVRQLEGDGIIKQVGQAGMLRLYRANRDIHKDEFKRYDEAVVFEEAVRAKPDDAEAHYNLGMAYLKLWRNGAAIKEYKQAIRIKPDFVEAYCNLGMAYWRIERYDEAIAALKQAINIRPNYAEAHYNLGRTYLITGDTKSALNEYKILKDLDQSRANTLLKQINK